MFQFHKEVWSSDRKNTEGLKTVKNVEISSSPLCFFAGSILGNQILLISFQYSSAVADYESYDLATTISYIPL